VWSANERLILNKAVNSVKISLRYEIIRGLLKGTINDLSITKSFINLIEKY